jgi:hypothetical protein
MRQTAVPEAVRSSHIGPHTTPSGIMHSTAIDDRQTASALNLRKALIGTLAEGCGGASKSASHATPVTCRVAAKWRRASAATVMGPYYPRAAFCSLATLLNSGPNACLTSNK